MPHGMVARERDRGRHPFRMRPEVASGRARSRNCGSERGALVGQPGRVPVSVVIVDDHPAFRRAARELLRARGHAVLGEADCAARALELVARLAPEAVLLDVQLGDECGLDVARALTHAHPGLRVLLVSGACDLDPEAVRASGACGLLHKSRLAAEGADPFAT
jgi:CheY-like chemotaxis protein